MFNRVMLLIAVLIQSGCATPAVSRIASTRKKDNVPSADVHVFVEPLPGLLQAAN